MAGIYGGAELMADEPLGLKVLLVGLPMFMLGKGLGKAAEKTYIKKTKSRIDKLNRLVSGEIKSSRNNLDRFRTGGFRSGVEILKAGQDYF